MLIVDSRAREQGGSLDAFQIRISPAIEGITGVSLLYASIANPDDLAAELYWGIRIREFGLPIRSAANSDSATSPSQARRTRTSAIPVNSSQGFRTLHRAESDFSRIEVQQPATPIYSLTVEVSLPGGQRPGLVDEWLLLIGLHY